MRLKEKREQLAISKNKTGKLLKIALIMFVGGGFANAIVGTFLQLIKANENIVGIVPKFFSIIVYGATIPLILAIRNGLNNKRIQATFEKDYKKALLTPIFNEFLDDCKYNSGVGFTKDYIQSLNITPQQFNRFSSNDKITGKHNNIIVERADVLVQNDVKSGKNKTTYTYFKGQVYTFDFNKKFSYQMQVIDKTDMYAIGDRSFVGTNMSKKTETENSKFNEMFSVYTMEDIEAFYLLTPTVMEAMMEMKRRLIKQISFSFLDNKLVWIFIFIFF